MSKKPEEKTFREIINEGRPDDPLTEGEAAMALDNLSGLIQLLWKINEREKIISLEELMGGKPPTETEVK
ncbi:MAG TPA: hypothetical protein VFR09_07705 [Alphaproteobacteria bacterium]|nr:hypothetical protein [Alphaproteobacteria bacterium]